MKLGRTILGVLVALGGGCVAGHAACTARSPQQALPAGWKMQSNQANSSAADAASNRYRLNRVMVDAVLHRRWAFIENCTHPEWPLQVVALAPGAAGLPTPDAEAASASQVARIPAERMEREAAVVRPAVSIQPSPTLPPVRSFPVSSAPLSSAMAPLIRAGDLVHLWSSEANVRLEIDVVALEYGRAGQVIHLRRVGQTMLLAGVVVGKDSAELMP